MESLSKKNSTCAHLKLLLIRLLGCLFKKGELKKLEKWEK